MVLSGIRNNNWTLYDYARIVFWTAVSVVLLTTVGVALGEFGHYIEYFSIVVQNPSGDFFGNSLTLILNIFSITFILVIFLVQNANQNYSNRLSRVIFHDRYFIGTVLLMMFASLYNLSGSYFNWGAPLTTIGFAFSISSIITIVSLILLAGYFVDVSNIIEYIAQQCKQTLSSDKIYLETKYGSNSLDQGYMQDLTTNIQLISSTCIRAIEENNHTLADTCLNSLLIISTQYLLETDVDDPNDDLLQNLNNEFQFIGSTAFEEDTRQKYAEDIAKYVGRIGLNITKRREVGTPGAIWAGLLKRLFEDSVEFDRNKVGLIAIEQLGEMLSVAILKSDYGLFKSYLTDLEEIAIICIRRDEIYFNNLVSNISQKFQYSYIAFLRSLCQNGSYSNYDLEQLLTKYSQIFVIAKTTFGYRGRTILFASIENPIQPFTAKLASELQRYYLLEISRQNILTEYLLYLNGFLQSISGGVETNKNDLYKVYTEVLYVNALFAPITQEKRQKVILGLNKKWVNLIDDTYRHNINNKETQDYHLEYQISNFSAIVIYFYRYNPGILTRFIDPLLQEYEEIKKDFSGQDRASQNHIEQLYLQLKIIGAWIDEVNDLENVSPELKQILTKDFYPSTPINSQIPFSGIEKYNYPVSDQGIIGGSRSGWSLRPDPIWSNQFQENISNLLNGDTSKHYETFHEELRARHHLQEAGKIGAVIQSIVIDKS